MENLDNIEICIQSALLQAVLHENLDTSVWILIFMDLHPCLFIMCLCSYQVLPTLTCCICAHG